jgi:4-hydroxyphenylpyruvate dioxygenase-like putative hemolysin
MKLDHVAFRVRDRHKTVDFIKRSFGYTVGNEFDIEFDDGSTAECFALVGPLTPVVMVSEGPEFFVSDGSPDSIVGKWVEERGGGGIHHIAYRVKDIDKAFEEWKENGVEFLSDCVIDCPDDKLRQIFTKPLDEMGGIIIELIERGDKGFCEKSVKSLMESTKEAQ